MDRLEHWNAWWELESRKNWDKFLNFQEVPEDAQEAAIKTVDRHRYTMTKDTFSMLHAIPAKNFELNYTTPMDWEWHECPYPKPTAKLYGAGHSANATEKTVWRHRWTDFPRTFETEIQKFIEGKNLRFTRGIARENMMEFSVFVLEGEGESAKTLVGPCTSSFRKDGSVVGNVRMAANKGIGFYRKVAQGILKGMPVSRGEWRRPMPRVELQARGNAISDAGGVASALVSKNVGFVSSVQTRQQNMNGRNVPEITVRVTCTSTGILPLVAVAPHSVLGSRMPENGTFEPEAASAPDSDTAFVDPAGLPYIKEGPAGAGGAAGVIYRFLGISSDPSFPEDVRAAITQPLQAKFHAYGEKKCVHVVGPDFRGRRLSREDAVAELTTAYKNVLAEFAASGLRNLRLLPISGGIFSGDFMPQLPLMTAEALHHGFNALTSDQQHQVLLAHSLVMCIFMEKELKDFAQAFSTQRAA